MAPTDDGSARSSRRMITAHDRRRLRVTWVVVAVGPVLGVLAAATVGILGASGAAGLSVLLLLSSAGCVAGALVTALLAVLDEFRRAPVATRRPVVAGLLFLAAIVLLVMSAGATGG